jgi:hypothetical protein
MPPPYLESPARSPALEEAVADADVIMMPAATERMGKCSLHLEEYSYFGLPPAPGVGPAGRDHHASLPLIGGEISEGLTRPSAILAQVTNMRRWHGHVSPLIGGEKHEQH